MSINTFPGRGTDQHEDFEEWDMDSILSRVELVCEFDALCDAIVAESLYTAKNFTFKDETIYVPQNRKILVINH